MDQMMLGAIAMGSFMAGLFFFRFWRTTRDSFFLWFALSFWLEAGNRTVLALLFAASELEPLFYLLRVVAYGLIVLAILQKNRRPTQPK